MNDMLVCCSGLTKSYGAKPALDHVDLQLAPGKIIGLLGPNGSGKTTLIKILTGLLRQTEGSVAIDGKPIGPETKALVSYLPDRIWSISLRISIPISAVSAPRPCAVRWASGWICA